MGKLLHKRMPAEAALRDALLAQLPVTDRETYRAKLNGERTEVLLIVGEPAELSAIEADLPLEQTLSSSNLNGANVWLPTPLSFTLPPELGTLRREEIYD
jgi:hypothetical protein